MKKFILNVFISEYSFDAKNTRILSDITIKVKTINVSHETFLSIF